MIRMTPPDENAWEAWSPEQLASKLCLVKAHWYIVGGWAIDLWLGKQSREHEDLEFAVSPKNAHEVASHLSELTFFEVREGRFVFWDTKKPIGDNTWQLWGADMNAQRWRVDMMMERGTHKYWQYKRKPSIEHMRHKAIRTNVNGIRYLAPPNVLLFKAKHSRFKDDIDFETVFPNLSFQDRQSLKSWLRLEHPDHKWLERFK